MRNTAEAQDSNTFTEKSEMANATLGSPWKTAELFTQSPFAFTGAKTVINTF